MHRHKATEFDGSLKIGWHPKKKEEICCYTTAPEPHLGNSSSPTTTNARTSTHPTIAARVFVSIKSRRILSSLRRLPLQMFVVETGTVRHGQKLRNKKEKISLAVVCLLLVNFCSLWNCVYRRLVRKDKITKRQRRDTSYLQHADNSLQVQLCRLIWGRSQPRLQVFRGCIVGWRWGEVQAACYAVPGPVSRQSLSDCRRNWSNSPALHR